LDDDVVVVVGERKASLRDLKGKLRNHGVVTCMFRAGFKDFGTVCT
jgi:hypothetical protein